MSGAGCILEGEKVLFNLKKKLFKAKIFGIKRCEEVSGRKKFLLRRLNSVKVFKYSYISGLICSVVMRINCLSVWLASEERGLCLRTLEKIL